MGNGKGRKEGLLYDNSTRGVHKFEITTQKPFAEFKDELNQSLRQHPGPAHSNHRVA